MQVAMMPGQSPSSTLNNGNASTPDPPVSSSATSSDADRLRASMEAWKRTAAIASERYNEARQRQIVAEREDRLELRKRWLEEEAKKRAENVGKQKNDLSGSNVSSNMPPPLYQSTPINTRDRKRHLDNNDYGHEEWRQGFRMMEGSGVSEISKSSTDMYGNMPYHTPNGTFYPGMIMPEMQHQGKGAMHGFPGPGFPNGASYPHGSYPPNGALPAPNGHFSSSKSTPNFRGNSFATPQTASSSSVSCSPMPSTSTADGSTMGQRYPSMELPQFPISADSTPVIQQQSQQNQFSTSDSTPYSCGMRPSPSMCPTSPNEVPTPPALANSGSVPLGSSCTSSAIIEQSLRSPAEDLGCNAVNEDNMTKMLTSIRTDSLGMLGADAVDSLFDSDVGDNDGAAGQVPLVTSTDSSSSPAGFSHGGPQSVHSVHSAPQSNSNCNPPSTPTPSAPLSTPFPSQVPTSQSSSFPQSSPQPPTFRPPSSPQQSAAFPSTSPNQPSSFPQNSQSQAPFFQQPSSSHGENFPPSTMATSTNFPMAPSSQNVGFPSSAPQPSNYPQHNAMVQQNAYVQQMPSAPGYPTSGPQPSTSNPYACAPSGGMMPNTPDPAFMAQQGMVNPAFGMNGYPGYDMPSSAHMSQQQQMAMQAHHQQQMMMGVGGAGGAMSAQQYHMVMMQKHQQMKAMMHQRAAMMYQGYPNGASMSQQQYFMHMQKMQQTRFASGVDPSAPAFMSGQRMMGMRGAPMGPPGPMMEPMAPPGGYPAGYSQGMQPFPPQQQYVGQFSMN
uniref:Trithorax group protein osa n=1 Tax=Haemonchus contortus TaxID=6289 RepID=A0A7I4YGZ5_HAECO